MQLAIGRCSVIKDVAQKLNSKIPFTLFQQILESRALQTDYSNMKMCTSIYLTKVVISFAFLHRGSMQLWNDKHNAVKVVFTVKSSLISTWPRKGKNSPSRHLCRVDDTSTLAERWVTSTLTWVITSPNDWELSRSTYCMRKRLSVYVAGITLFWTCLLAISFSLFFCKNALFQGSRWIFQIHNYLLVQFHSLPVYLHSIAIFISMGYETTK